MKNFYQDQFYLSVKIEKSRRFAKSRSVCVRNFVILL